MVKANVEEGDPAHEEIAAFEMAEIGLKRQVTSIDDRFKIMTITFKPEITIADNDTVSIMGEFTNWMPEIMDRYDSQKVLLEPELANTFYYKSKLFVGFSYRYNFSVGNEFVIDNTKEVSEDRLGKLTNFIEVTAGIAKPAVDEEMKEDENLDDVVAGLEEESKDAPVINVVLPGPPNLMNFKMPSYVNTTMSKMLPKDIIAKQGKRVIDNSGDSLHELL